MEAPEGPGVIIPVYVYVIGFSMKLGRGHVKQRTTLTSMLSIISY